MKPRIQWIAALAMAASATVAFGCCYTTTRVQPVREMIVEQPSSSLDWGAPFRAVGNVVSAPFVALGNAFSPSDRYIEPVGERLSYPMTTYRRTWTSRSVLMPVGERFTTVKIIRHKTLQPVGERFVTVRHHHKVMLRPVGERFTTVKIIRHKTVLEPVGEKITTIKYIKMVPVLEPVGERTIIRTTRVYSQPYWCY